MYLQIYIYLQQKKWMNKNEKEFSLKFPDICEEYEQWS